MGSRRVSLIHSFSMFQTSTESPSESSMYKSSSSVKPPIFTSCHSIAPRRTNKDMLNPTNSTSLKGTRSSSICVPSQSLQKIDKKPRRSCSIEGVAQNKRLSISTQGTLEMPERRQGFGQLPERKMSVANISEQFSSFLSLSSKMGVQVAKHVVSDLVPSPSSPTLDPNDVLENFIEQIKTSLKERDSHEVTLSDMKVSGVVLFNGRLSGLGNMSRWGNTTLEMKSDCVFLNCTLLLKDLHVIFAWKRRKLKGEIAGRINRAFLTLKMKQKVRATSAKPALEEFGVQSVDTVQLGLHGLGPFNWLGKRILSEKVTDNVRVLIEKKSKEMIKTELSNFSLVVHLSLSLIHQGITI